MKRILIVYIILLVVFIFAADTGHLPKFIDDLYDFPGGDKVGHILLMGLFAFFLSMSLPLRPAQRPWLSLLWGNLILAGLTALEELSQSLFRSRNPSLLDLASSYVGIVCFACLAWFIRKRRLPASSSRN